MPSFLQVLAYILMYSTCLSAKSSEVQYWKPLSSVSFRIAMTL